jgi:hypothetical protein
MVGPHPATGRLAERSIGPASAEIGLHSLTPSFRKPRQQLSGIHDPGLLLMESPGWWIPGSRFARPGMTEGLPRGRAYAWLAVPLPSAAWAAARRAMGTRKGEHET